MEAESLKREFLELLDKDLEFRYAVAGYLGLSEILKRLDSLAKEQVRFREEQTKIWNEIAKLREDMIAGFKRHDEEIAKLREDMVAGFKRHDEEIAKLREDMIAGFKRHDEEIAKLREEQTKIWSEIAKVWEEIKALREEQMRLREDFNRIYRQLDSRLSRVERTLEKMTLDIEEEARIVVKYRLRDMGYDVEVSPLILPEMELNIYGAAEDMCIIGEASVRAVQNLIDEINHHIEKMRILYPEKLKPKIIRVIYTSLAMPDLIERAEKEGIWVLKATGDIVKPKNL